MLFMVVVVISRVAIDQDGRGRSSARTAEMGFAAEHDSNIIGIEAFGYFP